jgi:hypothetical protein
MKIRIPSHDTRTGSRGRTLFISAVVIIVGAGVIAGLVLGLGGRHGVTPSPPAAPATHNVMPTPPITPQPPTSSAAVMDSATESALRDLLAHGNHQMGS